MEPPDGLFVQLVATMVAFPGIHWTSTEILCQMLGFYSQLAKCDLVPPAYLCCYHLVEHFRGDYIGKYK